MVKKLIIKYQHNGFEESFPQELIGIVGVKEYIEAIEIINIACLIQKPSFKFTAKKYLKPIIESINKTMDIRSTSFKIKFKSGKLAIEISYPDNLNTLPSLPTNSININGNNALILEPYFQPQPLIENPNTLRHDHQPVDSNFKNVLYKNEKLDFFYIKGFRGWEKNYNNQFYNYLSLEEYNNMMDDYNNTVKEIKFCKKKAKFYKVSVYCTAAIVGFIMVLPATIIYNYGVGKYNEKLDEKLEELNVKYNEMYGSRGFSISCERPDFNKNERIINIIIPRDVGNGPVLTNLSPNNQLIIAPSIPNAIAPKYVQNNNNYNNNNIQTIYS